MNEFLINNPDACYKSAEKKADAYFKSLYFDVQEKVYVSILIKDIDEWKLQHTRRNSLLLNLSRKSRKPDSKDYSSYIKWLDYTGRLDDYLDRSVSYIFMRDLGKDLNSSTTKQRVKDVVDNIKNHLTSSTKDTKRNPFNIARLYREAQKEKVEDTFIWVINKLRQVSSNIPEQLNGDEARRKLIKLIGGVVMHQLEEMGSDILPEERSKRLSSAIKLGYYYGLTYPFIDDILDAKFLSIEEKKQYSDLIRKTLITGKVPNLESWNGENIEVIKYIHSELKEAFEYIRDNQSTETIKTFFEQSYVFFNSQEVDREKNLLNDAYTNEDIYIPIILKASYSRLIVRSVIGASEDKSFDNRTFYYGIYNQLADDFTDMFDDMESKSLTPYTYYIKYHDKRLDLINPFELYWAVISNLIHNVYNSDIKTREAILSRAINSLKRFKEKIGIEKYKEIMNILTSGNHEFNSTIQTMVEKADDVDFFDKLIRDYTIDYLKNEKKEKSNFLDTIKTVRNKVDSILKIQESRDSTSIKSSLVEAVNYSLDSNGKRLRPIITWFMGVKEYGLKEKSIYPLLKSLEYMHTASLIFDDLPSQDNALTRRGRVTLHEAYNISTAELSALFLIHKAFEEQTSLNDFNPKTVLELIKYSSQITQEICRGQVMDLESKGKHLTIEQLELVCLYKTGLAFEASLIMPAILAEVDKLEIEILKNFAKNAGIAFQIKDDLLDVEGNPDILGKSTGKDNENNNSNFVTILGLENARKAMWEHYCLAIESLQKLKRDTTFLKHLLNYIINRNR